MKNIVKYKIKSYLTLVLYKKVSYLCNINNNDNAKMRSLSEKTKKY